MQLNELKVIVTGAAGGMGAHFARRFAESGARVAVGDVDEARMSELPASIHKRRLDVSDERDVISFVEWANEALGGVNALVNNAGIIRDGLLIKKDKATGAIVKMARADWDAVIGVNLTGATMMVREVAASMVANERPGVLINVSSISRHGNRGQSAYVAAKSALAANTVTWARELSRYKIRVGAIAPGMIETPMTQGMHQKAREQLVAAVPLGRIGDPEDIWHAVRFTVECEYFTGRCVDVDGGLVMT
jgi:3-oxoacyl-[acyl-carrier protein] reductase